MRTPGQSPGDGTEGHLAEWCALQARLRQAALAVPERLREGQALEEALAELAGLVAESSRQQARLLAGLQRRREQGLPLSAAGEQALAEARAQLAETVELLQSAQAAASAELRGLAEQLDSLILGQKRNRAYRAGGR